MEKKPREVVAIRRRTHRLLPWIRPLHGLVKCNEDGVVSRQGDRGGATAVCHVVNGLYLRSSSVTHNAITDVPTLEALAC